MRRQNDELILSGSDVANFLACRHLTGLDLDVAEKTRKAPQWKDPALEVLQERGFEHEHQYVESLRSQGLNVVDLTTDDFEEREGALLEEMQRGTDVIVQPTLKVGRWFGRPDLLRRVDVASELGNWSYEVVDTKLAVETRGGTILQLALYSDMLGTMQGRVPESFHVVTPDVKSPVQTYRFADFAAYCRYVRERAESTVPLGAKAIQEANYPAPVDHCDICRWWSTCKSRRRGDDHLSLVAGISRVQVGELEVADISTLAAFGSLPGPITFKPRRGKAESYERIRNQARVQLAGRESKLPVHERLAFEENQGLARLPAPAPGDLFLDLEGDAYAREGGREYLFGLVSLEEDGQPRYRAEWATTDAQEKAAFEQVVDLIMEAWKRDPGMHVYHYAPYEPSAFKRLMGRHASRESEIDRMLRAGLFVDLYGIVRQSVRASVEKYSIKDLEPFYGYDRDVVVEDARTNLRIVERALELHSPDLLSDDVRTAVEGYNRDDCVSALRLRDWLEELRDELVAGGTVIPRPEPKDGAPSEKIDERAQRVAELVEVLTAGVPLERSERSNEQQARWLLANLLEWHRRELKSVWWELFRLSGLADEDLLDERAAISGLCYVDRIGGTEKRPVIRYSFPPQESDVRAGDDVRLAGGFPYGSIEAVDRLGGTVDLKVSAAKADLQPSAVFVHSIVTTDVLEQSLLRLAEWVASHGLEDTDRYRASSVLLLREPPRLGTGLFNLDMNESPVDFAVRIAPELDRTVLAIQGPPGAGKTHTGAEMIAELVRQGRTVGVTAGSHKVIANLLEAVSKASVKHGVAAAIGQRVNSASDAASGVAIFADNVRALEALRDGRVNILGGTAWVWARPEFEDSVDVLFVDEAAQMSLANVLAVSTACRSLVLLGDPQQLEQPQKGSHPDETDVSALQHILGPHQTISDDRGIFLPETWRLAPAICEFTSEVFYEGKLHSREGLDRQELRGTGLFDGSGLFLVGVDHDGNRNSSTEEVDAVERVVQQLLSARSSWIDCDGNERRLTAADILVVAPYNAHVSLLHEKLGRQGISVGTVDKFQGQEAPVVIYSTATSTPEDAPRGMEFLYSPNRLNVATSRARCACILVASPRLFEPECRTPRQMQLANAFCRYREMARVVDLICRLEST